MDCRFHGVKINQVNKCVHAWLDYVAHRWTSVTSPAQRLPDALLTGVGPEEASRVLRRPCPRTLTVWSCVFQVAEMHGELIEFNERLHRALVAKEALVSQMRQELIDLRGPVSDLRIPQHSTLPHLCLSTQPFLSTVLLISLFIVSNVKGKRLKSEHSCSFSVH